MKRECCPHGHLRDTIIELLEHNETTSPMTADQKSMCVQNHPYSPTRHRIGHDITVYMISDITK